MSPSPIRGRGPWKIHKRSSESDRWLDEMGFFRKHTARDPSCLFRVVSENIYNTQRYFHKVRLDCVHFMASQRHLFEGSLNCPFENYLKEMSNPSEWGGLIEISAMSHLYRHDFVVFEANKGPQTKICNGYGDTIYLFYLPETKHFDAVYTKEFIIASAFCQSLVYEVLYDRVYQLKDLPYAVEKMLYDKVPSHHIEYYMSENVERRKKQKEGPKLFIEAPNEQDKDNNNNALALKCKHHTEEERASLLKESLSIFVFNRSLIQLENVCMNCLDVNSAKDLLDNAITPFPYKVAKALDPDIYRNIEFDAWSELRRELRYGARYCDGTTLQVGVKCLCKLQPDQSVPYHCHIQEMRPDGGPCLVFIEELGEKRIVNYDQLEALPVEQVKPWAPPYRYSRANSQILNLRQMLQQIGNISRKQGLGKPRKAKGEEAKPTGDDQCKSPIKNLIEPAVGCYTQAYTCPHLDYMNFQPIPVNIQALPLMVDCRPAGAPPHEISHPPNGAPPENHQNQQVGGSGDMPAAGGAAGAASVRASTPATNVVTTYSGNYNGAMNSAPPPLPGVGVGVGAGVGYGCAPYACGVKGVVWCGPHAPPPPPPGVNPHVYKSVQPSGADLPMNDIATLRFYFNLGVECMWAAYGAPPQAPLPPPHAPHPHALQRPYVPRDLVQDMQQMSLRGADGGGAHDAHKHKPQDKPPLAQPKPQGQRPLVGPRFKRGNNQDGNQNNNHNQNRGHNNNTPNKGPNNRRNSHTEIRPPHGYVPAGNMAAAPGDECALEPPIVTFPYLPYHPPPIYPLPYYPIDADHGMMGMMGGMGYVSYEEGVEYAPVQHFYPPPYPPPHLPDHK